MYLYICQIYLTFIKSRKPTLWLHMLHIAALFYLKPAVSQMYILQNVLDNLFRLKES